MKKRMIIISFFILASIPLIYLSSSSSVFMTEIPNVGAGMNVVEGDGPLYFVNFTGDIMRMMNKKVEPFVRGCQASYLYYADNTLYFLNCLTSEYNAVRMDGNVKTLYEFKDRVNLLFRSNHYLYAVIGRYNISKPETCSYIRVDLNDGTDTKLGNYYFSDYYTAVSGGNIYWNDKNKIYSMSIDGKNEKELFQGYANKLVAFNGAVYFNYDPNTVRQPNSLSNNVYDFNVHTGKSKTLARYADNEITTLLGAAGDTLIYSVRPGNTLKFDIYAYINGKSRLVFKGLNAYLQANYVGVTDNYIIYELRDENPQAINLIESKRYKGNQIYTYAISIKDGKLYLLDSCFFSGGFD